MRASLLLSLVALYAGCKALDPDPELTPFADCDAMRTYMKHMAMDEARYDWAWEMGFPFSQEYALAAPTEDQASGGGERASSYSTTNLQESGVDEADLMKTDGTYMYSVAGDTLVISKAWPLEEAEVLSTVAIDGAVDGIYLDGDVVVVLSRLDSWSARPSPRSGRAPDREEESFTLATVVDVSDRAAPEVVRETYATGALAESRKIGARLFVVTYQDLDIAPNAQDFGDIKKAINQAEATNWLPWRFDNILRSGAWQSDGAEACGCERVYASEAEGGTFLTNVLSLDVTDPLGTFEGESVVGRADTIYASPAAIYVGWGEWDEGPFPGVDDKMDTVLHKFDISRGEPHPSYLATAKVEGTLIDPFALSERDGVLRVALDANGETRVETLREEDGSFTHLDAVDGIAPGESLMSARFVGDIGYVVTFEQIDPLFTIDLSDPEDIRVAGELEVTGWSDYLHPMDEDHLLAVGMDEDGEDGFVLAVSLFDVSDLEAPALLDRELLPAWYSEAQDEHHAFNYFAEARSLVIPSMAMEGQSVLEVLHADTTGLSWTGRVDQATLEAAEADTWCGQIRRSVIMEDKVWAVSSLGLSAAALAAPEEELASVRFSGVEPCSAYEGYYGW